MGGVTGVSTMIVWDGVGMPRYCRMAYPGQYPCRARYMIFLGFTISKTYTYYVFNLYMYYKKEHLWYLVSPWPGVAKESLDQPGMF